MGSRRTKQMGKKPEPGGRKAAPPKPFVGRIESRDLDVHYPPGIEVIRYKYTKRDPADAKKLRDAFDEVRKAFLKDLAAKQEAALRKAGLDDDDLARMKDGLCPEGYQVHHKKSLDDNGTNDTSNLVLIDNDPYHIGITNEQKRLCGDLAVGESKTVNFPVPKGFIFPATPPA